jgi:hypothetical protein
MTVTWTSGYDSSDASPIVEWGMEGSPPVRTTADTSTFGRESLCGMVPLKHFFLQKQKHCMVKTA